MILMLLIAAAAVSILFPQTTIGRWLRRVMIDHPARKLPYLTPIRLVMVLAGLAAMAAVVLYAKDQGVAFLVQGAPEAISGFVTFDVGAYMEIVALVSMLAIAARFQAVVKIAAALPARISRSIANGVEHGLRRARREIRTRPRRPLQRPKTTDEEARWVGLTLRPA